MLNINQLAKRIADFSNGSSVDDFEDWFREESRNVHLWGNKQLNEAVFAVEAVFSEYHHAGLSESAAKDGMSSIGEVGSVLYRIETECVRNSNGCQNVGLVSYNAFTKERARIDTRLLIVLG